MDGRVAPVVGDRPHPHHLFVMLRSCSLGPRLVQVTCDTAGRLEGGPKRGALTQEGRRTDLKGPWCS